MGIIGYIIRLFGLMGLQRRWGGDGGDGDGGGDGGGDDGDGAINRRCYL